MKKMYFLFILTLFFVVTSCSIGTNATTFTITFDSSGGTTILSQKVDQNSFATKPNNPVKEGYIFVCWLNEQIVYDFSTPVTSDITLVAKWEDVKSHSHKYVKELVAPTCLTNGYTMYSCYCGDHYEEDILARLRHECIDGLCTKCGNKLYDINTDKTQVTFGQYPQSLVNDENTLLSLAKLTNDLPTEVNSHGWTSYKYYVSNSNEVDYMWYLDLEYDDNMYRAVYFTQYRPIFIDKYGADNSWQITNGYYVSTVYYFKYEPITWNILALDDSNNSALLLSSIALDAQEFYPFETTRTIDGMKIYANNYEYSTIRKWLNETFYNLAFTEITKTVIDETLVDNSLATTGYTSNTYICNDTLDNVFLLSYSEIANTEYGFTSNTKATTTRQLKSSDYANCQGCFKAADSSILNNIIWWTRSSYKNDSTAVQYVDGDGSVIAEWPVSRAHRGVVPALWILL